MANQYKDALEQVRAREQLVGKIQGVVQQWFSIYAAVRMVGNAIRSVISTIQELDKTITEIAIVTDMTQEDLWGQMQSYTEMARSYASSISGVYKVSQLYYQQGLQTADVMALTEQTLKMARISGLDYAEATNYMTNAVRSFKMEMTDAQRVVDVYSAIAAASATDTTELAEAMSKTASSAEAVGSSFENTTAMMAVMIEATRESASNIGSAMKSIISRYGEMTSDPSKIVDSEGQEMSLNKVDKALQSVGISIHDATGQFRDFDDVIMELAESWDTIDKNTQRYIATVMAGNRQQSRFLALVSSYDRLKELSATAADSEDASQLQFLKTLDSVDAKLQQLQTSMQSLYVDSGLEKAYKGLLDLSNNVVKTFTQMPKVFNLPILAITKFGASFFSLAKIVTTAFGLIKTRIQHSASEFTLINKVAEGERLTESEKAAFRTIINEENKYKELARIVREGQQNIIAEERTGSKQREEIAQEEANKALQLAARRDQGKINKYRTAGMAISSIGMLGSLVAGNIDVNQNKNLKGIFTLGSSLASGVGTMMMMGGPTPVGIISGIVTALPGVAEAIGQFYETAEERALKFKQAAEEANNALIQKKADYQDLNDLIKQYEKLERTQYESEEARKEFYEVGNQLAEKYPELLQAFDSEGNALINVADSYLLLADAREKAKEAAQDAANTSTAQTENAVKEAEKNRKEARREILLRRAEQEYSLSGKTHQNFASDVRTSWVESAYSDNPVIPSGVDADSINDLLLALQFGFFDDATKFLDNENLQNSLNTLRKSADENLQEIIKFIDSYTAGLISVDADIEKKRTTNKNQERASLAKLVDISNSEQLDIASSSRKDSVLKEFAGADILISNYIYSQFEQYKKNLEQNPSKRKKDKTILQQFNEEQYEEVYTQAYELLENIYSSIANPEDRKKVEEIIKNRSKYTQEQLIAAINNIIGSNGFEALVPAINELYTNVFDGTKFEEAISEMKDTLSTTSFDSSLFGSSELQKIFEVYKNIYQGIENNQFDADLGQGILDNYLSILSFTISLNDNSRELAQSLLLNTDVFTLSGLYDLKQAVEESDLPQEIIGFIDRLISIIPANLQTEFSTFAQENVKKLEDFDKALSSASKGMELDDAIKMADKLNVSINDFEFKNGKYFYSNATKIKKGYLKYNEELLKVLEEKFQEISPDVENYAELKESHDRAVAAIKQYSEYQVNAILLQNGQIEQFLESALGTDIEGNTNWGWLTAEEQAALINAVKNGDINNLPESATDYTGQLMQYAGLIYSTYGTINNEIANTILNSLESGALITSNSLNADQYARLAVTGIVEAIGGEGDAIVYKVIGNAEEIAAALSDLDLDQATSIKLHNEQYKNNAYDIFSNLINSYDNISYETLVNLAKLLNKDIDEIEAQFTKDYTTGTYSSTPSQILQMMEDEGVSLSEAANSRFKDVVINVADSWLSTISNASSYMTKGTSDVKNMQQFLSQYNELVGEELQVSNITELFDMDVLDPTKFYLNREAYSNLIEATLTPLKEILQITDDEFNKLIDGFTKDKILTEVNSNIQSFVSTSERTTELKRTLEKSLIDYYYTLGQSEETAIQNAQNTINKLSQGGTEAVAEMKVFLQNQGKEITADQIEKAYRAAIVLLEDAQAQLEYGIGSLASGLAIDVLRAADYQIDDNGVIESIGDLNKAYLIYYQTLKNTNGATTAAINAAYAKVLETSDGEQVIIDALSDAAGMTYTRLGDILASVGKRLDKEFNNINQYIESIGGNKIRIKDFAGFASYMGWEANSEEYWSAFKTYNDAMADLNRKAERNIKEELQNAINAQEGDWINLTQLTSKIPEELLNQIISGTGAVIENGILKLDEGATTNIAEIVSRILDITSSSGLLLDNEINELKDAIQNLLETYINLFKNGIFGSLSSADAGKLQSWASTLNPGLNLDFTKTAEGLKLSNQSAIDLYQSLKSIDALRANLIFDDLVENLQKSDDRFSSISHTMGTIANLENQIKSARGINTVELEKQLSLAQEIARAQAIDPSSYDFMSRSLPDAFKGPQNYWDSIGEMFNTINTSAKDGYMGIQAFYNIVNEMNNLASLGADINFMGYTLDGSLESAASLIEAGFGALSNIDGEGVKIDLSKFGVDFASGADQMNANVQEGIKAMAQSQIDMLDALIQMLEAIVAFEELGKIDVNNDGLFDWKDMFESEDSTEYLEAYDKQRQKIMDMSKKNPDFQAALDSFKINLGEESFVTLRDILTKSARELEQAGFSIEQQMELIPKIIGIISNLNLKGDLSDVQTLAAAFAELGTEMSVVTDKANITLYGGYNLQQKNGKYIVDGKEFTNAQQAAEYCIIKDIKDVKNVEIDKEGKTVGTMNLNGTVIKVTTGKEGITYTLDDGSGRTATSRQGLYELLFESATDKQDGETVSQWTARVGISKVEITPSSYQNIQESIRTELEKALATGDTDQVQEVVLNYKAELGSLQGLSNKEIEERIGLQTATININAEEANKTLDDTGKKADEFIEGINSANPKLNVDARNAISALSLVTTNAQKAKAAILSASNQRVTVNVNDAVNAAYRVQTAWQNAASAIIHASNVLASSGNSSPQPSVITGSGSTRATGNVALAKGHQTLLGELGPELYVTGGHYYVAGQNGAEFVNLPDDAIVFNHLQTERLLKNGSAGRGKAVSSEKRAVAHAKGNAEGSAMASASAALSALKQIRAMWDAMLNASIADLGSKAGLGKKAGGGSGSKTNGVTLDAGYIKDLERWYNLLRQIDRLEQDINYEEKLRAKLEADSIAHGKEIYESQRKTYDMLQREVDRRVELAELKKGYYEQRMEEIANGPWGNIFYFNEEGTPQMKNLEFLANVFASTEEGGAVHSAREQYAMLQEAGFGGLLQFKEDGSRIEWYDEEGKAREEAYKEAVEAFSAKLDAQTDEINGLREDYIEEMGTILELQTKQNEILTQIRENTIEVEKEVLKALEESRQAEIDELQDQRDALSDSADKFINGLNDSLNRERDMYSDQESDKELTSLRRQLGILQRSGASASQIRSIQEKISQREQDAYFNQQQKQIDTVKQASDLQLERLDSQLSIMAEALEYQKAHGLLWEEVRNIMQGSSESIAEFITTKNPEWWAKSNTEWGLDIVALRNEIEQWTTHRDDTDELGVTIKDAIQNGIVAITDVVGKVSDSILYNVYGNGGLNTTAQTNNYSSSGSYTPATSPYVSSTTNTGSSTTSSTTVTKKTVTPKTEVIPTATASTEQVTSTNDNHGYSFIFNGKNYTGSGYASIARANEAAGARIAQLGASSGYTGGILKKLMEAATGSLKVYKKGGIIDFTGPAWVDGTKSKPEGILNAEQLDMLRNSVLTRSNPIAALIADYSDSVRGTANSNTYNTIDRGESTVIENAQVVMNVSKMSNDYDARQAGRAVLNEMVRISRKTKPTGVSRR